jgi:hypothetical protein
MVALPAATADTTPVLLTVAALVLLDVQLTVLFVASLGVIVAVNADVLPFVSDNVALFKAIPVTFFGETVMFVDVLKTAFFVVAVIVAVPTPTAVTLPLLSTTATLVSELLQDKESLFMITFAYDQPGLVHFTDGDVLPPTVKPVAVMLSVPSATVSESKLMVAVFSTLDGSANVSAVEYELKHCTQYIMPLDSKQPIPMLL